ncbi:hypothetical protein CHU98_g10056 [Xylaria longipes]|nr:hypothetical protein CHU98_g10056 [Xylaria longipes]
MHLLNVHTRQLQEFIGDRKPPYAILSHTWGEDEVLFQDLSNPEHKNKLGYKKIEGCCEQAIREGFEFVWVDTCCIDKRSSAELSEAINSMFRWYGNAQVCYVYLIDVIWEEGSEEPYSAFRNSRWFTRGWTLQELIAPIKLHFFDTTWSTIFYVEKHTIDRDRDKTCHEIIEEITGIRCWYLHSVQNISTDPNVPVAIKLSWASGRKTTRAEDMAYCLLGLLDVNMPLLYGEGHKAFLRLQEEFLKRHYDPTILCWGFGMDRLEVKVIEEASSPSCLAPTPVLFGGFRGISLGRSFLLHQTPRLGWTVTPSGLRIDLPVMKVDARRHLYIGVVADYQHDNRLLAIPLRKSVSSDVYKCVPDCGPFLLGPKRRSIDPSKLKSKIIHLEHRDGASRGSSGEVTIDVAALYENGFALDSTYPPAIQHENHTVHSREKIRYSAPTRSILVLHRERRDTLYLRCTVSTSLWGKREPRKLKLKLEMFSCLYEKKSSALEVWDAGRKVWERSFQNPSRLNWQETATIGARNRVEYISSKWGVLRWVNDRITWKCVIDVKVRHHDTGPVSNGGPSLPGTCGRDINSK